MNHTKDVLRMTFGWKAILTDLLTLKKATKWLLLAMIASQVVTFIFSGDRSQLAWLTLWTGLATVTNLALVDQGKQSNFFWGLLCTSAWMIVALNSRTFGDVFAQGFAFIMQFFGIYFWSKHRNEQKGELIAKSMPKKLGLLTAIITIIVYIGVLMISKHLNGLQVYLDSAVLPLNIIGQVLMTYGYRSQWFAWLLVNLIQVIVWSQNIFILNGSYAVSMLVLQIVMLLNSIYGTWYWYNKQE
ncbi:nicotinamide riboside transporter PnuC [Convivina intestini]|uniref:Nicotinamide mononucleotide transporter n=1 Tax=Convivina intestini TaxID=1505726 RepID=A0A2U1DEL8_9LACO|nr:nicotinamide riboside transporter PnuC [Convivina intestini]PVY86104.1 nicotinamide mononucleotide transporter [Convivina intestini]CAH1851467.1 Nicotinamide riboside transporter PnuC [Convivina intestini]CAH1853085.1 Nicotinamide riboside transporter PnuC [Convivina intestini]SDB80821.1 nicotinamide mononucleotide transporter [Leuconostocaceae bacterium R-53105]